MLETLKLFLGLTSKFATFRDQDHNKFFGLFQGFDFIDFIPEIEKIFSLIYQNVFGINQNKDKPVLDKKNIKLVNLTKRENNQIFIESDNEIEKELKKVNKYSHENKKQIINFIF